MMKVAVTFPTPYNLLKRIFKDKKRIYIKNSIFNKINNKMKIVFYASQEKHAFIGHADIEKVEFLNIKEILEIYERDVFLTKDEILSYSKGTRSRDTSVSKFLTLSLKNIEKFKNPVKPPRFISMLGRYIESHEYQEILKKAFE